MPPTPTAMEHLRENWLYSFPPQIDTLDPAGNIQLVSFQMDDYASAANALGINWRPETRAIAILPSLQSMPYKAVLHPAGRLLDIVKSGAKVPHHMDFFSQIQRFLSNYTMLFVGGGQIYGGKIVSIRAQSISAAHIDDDTQAMIILSMSYNRSRPPSITAFARIRAWEVEIPIGVIPVAYRRGDVSQPMIGDDLMARLGDFAESAKTMVEIAKADQPASDHHLVSFWESVYQKPAKTTVKRVWSIYNHLTHFYSRSMWLATLAVCIYEDYRLYFSAQEQDRRSDHCFFGIAAKTKRRALLLASANTR